MNENFKNIDNKYKIKKDNVMEIFNQNVEVKSNTYDIKASDVKSHLLFKIDDVKNNLKTKEYTLFDARGFNA